MFIGPQSALEFEWRVLNTGRPLEVGSPDTVLRLRVSAGGREIPVRTEWARTMTLRSGTPYNRLVSVAQPVGATTLSDGSSLSVRGSTRTLAGSPFPPGDYVVQLAVAAGVPSEVRVDAGFPIQLHIVGLTSPERRRQFHMIEGAFYKERDHARARTLRGARCAPWRALERLAPAGGDVLGPRTPPRSVRGLPANPAGSDPEP